MKYLLLASICLSIACGDDDVVGMPDAGLTDVTPQPDGNPIPDANAVTPDANTVTPDANTVTPDADVTPDANVPDGNPDNPDATATPDAATTPDATTPDAMTTPDATITLDASIPDMNILDDAQVVPDAMIIGCTYDNSNGVQGVGCLPRCDNSTLTALSSCSDSACTDQVLSTDTTPPVDITIDGQTGTLNCAGCFQVQVTACQTQFCAAPIDAYFACRTNNNCAAGDPCATCDTQLGAANSCIMANDASIDMCINNLAGMCFGETVADPGCTARFDTGISGDDCTPRCSQDTANTIVSCPDDDPNTANDEASDCLDAALQADTTPTGMIDPFTDPVDCESCWDVTTELCLGITCPNEYDELFSGTCSAANNCDTAADRGACLTTNCPAEVTAYQDCVGVNSTAIQDCIGRRIGVCFP